MESYSWARTQWCEELLRVSSRTSQSMSAYSLMLKVLNPWPPFGLDTELFLKATLVSSSRIPI